MYHERITKLLVICMVVFSFGCARQKESFERDLPPENHNEIPIPVSFYPKNDWVDPEPLKGDPGEYVGTLTFACPINVETLQLDISVQVNCDSIFKRFNIVLVRELPDPPELLVEKVGKTNRKGGWNKTFTTLTDYVEEVDAAGNSIETSPIPSDLLLEIYDGDTLIGSKEFDLSTIEPIKEHYRLELNCECNH